MTKPNTLKKAARRKLGRLLANQDGKCHWCQCPLVVRKYFPQSRIVRAHKDWVIWRHDTDGELKSWWASADHVVPINAGGSSQIDNLVAACQPCNRRRNDNYRQANPTPSKWRGLAVCKCGGPKPLQDHRCQSCRDVSQKFARLARGYWIYKDPNKPCGKCGSPVVPLANLPPVGMLYRCSSCVKPGRRAQKVCDEEEKQGVRQNPEGQRPVAERAAELVPRPDGLLLLRTEEAQDDNRPTA